MSFPLNYSKEVPCGLTFPSGAITAILVGGDEPTTYWPEIDIPSGWYTGEKTAFGPEGYECLYGVTPKEAVHRLMIGITNLRPIRSTRDHWGSSKYLGVVRNLLVHMLKISMWDCREGGDGSWLTHFRGHGYENLGKPPSKAMGPYALTKSERDFLAGRVEAPVYETVEVNNYFGRILVKPSGRFRYVFIDVNEDAGSFEAACRQAVEKRDFKGPFEIIEADVKRLGDRYKVLETMKL